MQGFNIFYITILLLGISLFFLLRPGMHEDLSFYGFAESNETEINYNYPVVVDRILVNPGQAVQAGEEILHLSRRQSKERLEDQQYRIAELEANEKLWRQEKENELSRLRGERQIKSEELASEIQTLEKELAYKKSLTTNLQTIQAAQTDYSPLEEKIRELQSEKNNVAATFAERINGLQQELRLGKSPYREQIKRLDAEREFEASQRVMPIVVTAPADGLIGNISCKEEEHVPAYNTLLSFYEPHSGIIKGFVHEDLTLRVQLGDRFVVRSLKDQNIRYEGRVIGLGSRIVEIPPRLRKIPDLKTYGREVLVAIPLDNSFLQKEKVSLRFLSSN